MSTYLCHRYVLSLPGGSLLLMLQRHEERSQRSRHFSNSSFAFFYQVSHRCFSYQYHRLLNPSRHVFFTFIVFSHSVAPCPAILVIRFCFTALTRRFLTLSADAVSFIPLFCSVYIPSVPWQWILNSFQGQQLAKVHIRTIKPVGMQPHHYTGLF